MNQLNFLKFWIRFLSLVMMISVVSIVHADPRQSLPVSIFIAKNSLWTRAEILDRFNNSRSIFLNSCNLDLSLKALVESSDPTLQDINLDLDSHGIEQKLKIASLFSNRQGAILIYARNAVRDQDRQSVSAQSFTKGRWIEEEKIQTGNLWTVSESDQLGLHGMIVITEDYSKAHPRFLELHQFKEQGDFDVDAHELGHIFLNDSRHSDQANIMASQELLYQPVFDSAQCAWMAKGLLPKPEP